jgi:predicted enzyme related to lactoylglutathione lyase
MRNPEGTPIWYELLTNDAAASTKFYDEVMGWKATTPRPDDAKKHQAFETGQGMVGGMMQLTDEMRNGGAKPAWLFYIGVDDVDATVAKIEAAGGRILMKAFDIPNIGRLAMSADPHGIPFYVMRGAVDAPSTAFERNGMGKCNWNELATPDPTAASDFFAKIVGWTYPEKWPMGEAGDYVIINAGDARIGGMLKAPPGGDTGWNFYFRVPDIEAAAERVKNAGGKILAGPRQTPNGQTTTVAADPGGVRFGLVASHA